MGTRPHVLFLLVSLLPLAAGAAGGEEAPAPAPQGHRLLGIDVTTSESGDYDRAFALARSAGLQACNLSLSWDDVEDAPGQFGNPYIGVANRYFPRHDVRLTVTMGPVDTNNLRVPLDLAGKPLDDREVRERFQRALDYVLGELKDVELTCLSVGNEVDAYLGDDEERWQQYDAFLEFITDHLRRVRPKLRVGVKATFAGLTGPRSERLAELNRHANVILVTYYPLQPDFTVRPPSEVESDFRALTELYSRKPIYFLETGYPSGAIAKSSPEMQATFVRRVFAAWDRHAEQIPLVCFTWLTDMSPAAVQEAREYYGIDAPAFADFLATLGLRTYAGEGGDKPALGVLRAEAKSRGW